MTKILEKEKYLIVTNNGSSLIELLITIMLSSFLLVSFSRFNFIHINYLKNKTDYLLNEIELNRVGMMILNLGINSNRIKGINGVQLKDLSKKDSFLNSIYFIIPEVTNNNIQKENPNLYLEISPNNFESLKQLKSNSNNFYFPVKDHILIYNDVLGVLRQRDLISGENQPISNLVKLKIISNQKIELSLRNQKLEVELNFKKTNFLTLLEWN